MKLTAIIVSATVITGVLCGCAEEKKSYKERTTRVVTGKMEKRTLRRQIPLQGTVMPVEYATISAKISGTLETFKVDEGDRRKAGDMLFGIDRQILKNQLVVKEDEIKVREAALQSAGFALTAAEINIDFAVFLPSGSSSCINISSSTAGGLEFIFVLKF